MAPARTTTVSQDIRWNKLPDEVSLDLPEPARERLLKAGVDLSTGYPYFPSKPERLDEVLKVRNDPNRVHVDPGTKADPKKKALFGAATKIIDLTKHIGTEIVGLQLKDLNDEQKDELAALIAERSVVFFRDQDLSPAQQLELGKHFGQLEIHPAAPQVPGFPGVSVIWDELGTALAGYQKSFRTIGGTQDWHTDLVHEIQPPGITHLHNDTIPEIGGDTLWASGYSAYDKLSPTFQKLIEGLQGVYRSAHTYIDPEDPKAPPKPILRVHSLVRTHPVTGWKSLFLNRKYTLSIVGLDQGESDAILGHLFDVYERSLDIQVRFKWTPRTSALWDNRVTIHAAVWDYAPEPRHGTRVASLAEVPYLDPKSTGRREALGLDNQN